MTLTRTWLVKQKLAGGSERRETRAQPIHSLLILSDIRDLNCNKLITARSVSQTDQALTSWTLVMLQASGSVKKTFVIWCLSRVIKDEVLCEVLTSVWLSASSWQSSMAHRNG